MKDSVRRERKGRRELPKERAVGGDRDVVRRARGEATGEVRGMVGEG